VSVAAFLAELRNRDMEVWADGDQLRLNAPAGALTPELRDHLQRRKSDILAFLRTAGDLAGQQRAIVPLQPHGTRDPVFATAGHNGDVFTYRALAQRLGDAQPFFGLEPPGLDGRSEPLTSVEALAGYFADQITAFRPSGPSVIAGYCAGSTIAFELARQLVARGAAVKFVALFAGPWPLWYRPLPQLGERARNLVTRVRHHGRALASLSVTAGHRYLRDHLSHRAAQRDARLRSAADPALIPQGKLTKVTLAAVRRYIPRDFAGRLSLFVPNRNWLHSRYLSERWRSVARDFEVWSGPDNCDGDDMLLEPHAAVIADLFTSRLATTHATL
jgi:thioesterase domain-containing protein